MACITIELRSNHGMGEPLVLEIPVPDTPDRTLDKSWPQIDPPYPKCKQILYCSCRLDLTYRLHNSLSHLRFDTLEEACFSGVENTVYDGLDDHQNFRSVRRRHRTEDFIAITMDNQVIWLRSRTNHAQSHGEVDDPGRSQIPVHRFSKHSRSCIPAPLPV